MLAAFVTILFFLLPSNFFKIFFSELKKYSNYIDINFIDFLVDKILYILNIFNGYYYYFYNIFFDIINPFIAYFNLFYKNNFLMLYFLIVIFFTIFNLFLENKSNYFVKFTLSDIYIVKIRFLSALKLDFIKLKKKLYFKYILNFLFNFNFKWSPIFKKTSYFGLYNFSKNKNN